MLFFHDQGHSKWPWVCEIATLSTWPVCKFGIDAVAVSSALGTNMWEGWYDMMLRTGYEVWSPNWTFAYIKGAASLFWFFSQCSGGPVSKRRTPSTIVMSHLRIT